MLKRIFANIILFFGVLFLPWWLTAAAAIVFIFTFKRFYEVVLWALFADLLYGAPVALWYNASMVASFAALLLFVSIELFKEKLRFYQC